MNEFYASSLKRTTFNCCQRAAILISEEEQFLNVKCHCGKHYKISKGWFIKKYNKEFRKKRTTLFILKLYEKQGGLCAYCKKES